MDYLKENWLTVVIVLALGFGLGFLVSGGSNESESNQGATPSDTADSKTPQEETEEQDETTPQETPDTDEGSEEAPKQPAANENVSLQPVIFTGFGNTSERPLGLGQTTSTTCTTDANTDCSLTFTNSSSGQVVTFDIQTTDSNGVTRWVFTGADIGEGSWDVQAQAGDKTSETSKIYISN